MAEVRPNGSAEPSVELAEPFGFGRTSFLADRSYTSVIPHCVLGTKEFYLLQMLREINSKLNIS